MRPLPGSLCWFQEALSAFHGAPRRVRGLGLLPYSNCVHYDAEPARRAEYHRFVSDGMRAGFAVEDGVALHFRGTQLERVVSSRPNGSAYLVEPADDGVIETRLDAKFLGAPGHTPDSTVSAPGAPTEARRQRITKAKLAQPVTPEPVSPEALAQEPVAA